MIKLLTSISLIVVYLRRLKYRMTYSDQHILRVNTLSSLLNQLIPYMIFSPFIVQTNIHK